MGIGASVFLIALGAILAFAVEYSVSGIDLATVGYILMIAGAIGLIASLALINGLWGSRRSTVVDDDYVDAGPRRVVRRRSYLD